MPLLFINRLQWEKLAKNVVLMKRHFMYACLGLFVILSSACSGRKTETLQRKVDSLSQVVKGMAAKNKQLTEELAGYQNSPDNLCADMDNLLKTENLSKLTEIQVKLKKYHPTCSQLQVVNGYIQKIKDVQQKRIEEEKAKRMQAVNILRKKHDDVSGMTWYFSKKARNSGTYSQLYLGKGEGGDVYLRLQMQYHGEDWIFFDQAYLSYDGNTREIEFNKYKDKETDVSGGVWEWIDVNVDDELPFIKKMVNGNSVKWRLEGRYTETRKFSAQEIAGMKEVLLAYDVLKNGR